MEETAISPLVEEHSAELGYRAALTVNTLTSTEFEVASAVAGTTIDLADNEFLSAAIVRQAVMSQRGANIKSKSDGMFAGVIHPFPAYDLLNDNTIGGVIDILKHVQPGVDSMLRGIQGYRVIDLAGVRFIETTTVPTTAAFPSGSKVGYHTYIVGKDAIFSVSLGATETPGERNFNLLVKNYRDASVADPANVIGSSVAYNFNDKLKRYTAMYTGKLGYIGEHPAMENTEGSLSDPVETTRRASHVDGDIVRSFEQSKDVEKRRCKQCGIERPLKCFRKHPQAKGSRWICKGCGTKNHLQYYKRNPILQLLQNARNRAKRDSVPFDLLPKDINIPQSCPVLGLELKSGNRHDHANAPTIDRIEPTLGYIPGNIRVISHRANMLKSNATLDEMRAVVRYLESSL